MQHTHSTLRHILEMLMHTCTLLPPLDKLILSPVRSLAALAGKRLLNDRYGYNVTAGTGNLQREYIGARVCVGTWKRVTVVTQHMEHEYFNIWSNKIAVTPHCVMFFLSTLPLRPSWSLSLCGARSLVLRAKYTCHLCTSCNEAPLHTLKELTKPFPVNISYSSNLFITSSFSPCPPPSLISFLSLSLSLASPVSPANQHSLFPLALVAPPSSCWANLMSVFISLTPRHFSLLLQADTWPEW